METSKLATGSSANIKSGLSDNILAIPNLLLCPPLIFSGFLSKRSSM